MLAILFAMFVPWVLSRVLQTGQIRSRYGRLIERSSDPLEFWFRYAILASVGVGAFMVAVLLAVNIFTGWSP